MPDWNRIKEHYRRNSLAIYEAGRDSWGIDPYAWDHEAGIVLTPIELMLWADIRRVAAILYPQYPVAGYFVDFANPVARVGIECDGAAYHTDAKRDAIRQKAIEDNGWVLYRITGSDCCKDDESIEDDYGRQRYQLSPAYKFVRDIADRHDIRLQTRGTGEIRRASDFLNPDRRAA